MTDENPWLDIYKKTLHVLVQEKQYQNKHVDLSKIASALGTNVNYVSKAINSCSKNNFNTLLISIRVSVACDLLKHKHNMTMTEIGKRCGFGSRASFYRGFKKIMGVSPKIFAMSSDKYELEKLIPEISK